MNKCIYHRIRSRKKQYYGYCTKYRKEVPLFCKCNEIESKVHTCILKNSKTHKFNKIRSKSNELAKLERNRFSILTNDLNLCIICGSKKEHLHEVFFGCSRQLSIKYGIVIPLCSKCHTEMHRNIEWQDYWHKKGQIRFNEVYPNLDFLNIFKRNYL